MDGRYDDTDPSNGRTNGRDIDTDKASGTITATGLCYPRDFLLADERPEDYELNVAALAQGLQPRGALERRQVDLIAVADWEGMRHRRLIAALLHPAQEHLQPAETPSEHTARQYVEALASVNGKECRPKKNFLPEPSPGDRATTADILRAQRNNMAALEFHQRQAVAAERARRLLRMDLFERWVIQGRKDLSARYLREALGRRRRALEAYLELA